MANFDTIKTAIDANIKTNGTQDITGGKMNSILKQMVDATEEQLTELESELNGVLLTDGSNYYETKKGQRYFFRNDGNNLPAVSIYEVVGEESSLVVNLGSVAVGGIKEYVATQDAQIIYISKLGGTAIKFFADGVGFDAIKTSLNFEKVNNEIKDVESEINGISLKAGDNQFAMVSGETYAFINDGSVGVNVGYKVDSSQASSTRFITGFAPGSKTIYTATENSAIINISSISGASVRVYKSSDIGGQSINIENNLIELAEDVNGIAILPGKDTAFETKIGKTYYIENRSNTGFNLYYRGEDGQGNLIGNLSGGQVIKYEPKVNSSVVYISNIAGAKGAIYQEGMKGYSIAELSYNSAQSQEIIESQLVGILLGSGINNFSMKKGNTYVFVNEGAGVNLGYQINSESEYVAIGNIPAENSLTYRATADSDIIYLSLISDVAVRVFLRSNLTTIEDDKPILLKACSFNVGDFTGEGFETPSEDGKLTYHKLLGKIGANLMGTQEDVDFYGTTTSGGTEREDVKNSIYPMFKFYTRTGTGFYNYKGFASDYKIINIDKVYYTGDYYFTHPWFLRGDLEINGKSILVLSFHWEWRDTDTRMAQIAQVIEYAQNYDYVIAMGDTNSLNAKDGEYIEDGLYRYGIEWQLFKDAGYDMANNGNFGLFTTSHGGSPIDNIFVKGGKIKNAYIIQEEWMQDHYPIVADIVL